MNKQRRQRLREVNIFMNSLLTTIETIKDTEESAYDNIPENLQESSRAYEMEDNIESLNSYLILFASFKTDLMSISNLSPSHILKVEGIPTFTVFTIVSLLIYVKSLSTSILDAFV